MRFVWFVTSYLVVGCHMRRSCDTLHEICIGCHMRQSCRSSHDTQLTCCNTSGHSSRLSCEGHDGRSCIFELGPKYLSDVKKQNVSFSILPHSALNTPKRTTICTDHRSPRKFAIYCVWVCNTEAGEIRVKQNPNVNSDALLTILLLQFRSIVPAPEHMWFQFKKNCFFCNTSDERKECQ